MRDLNHGPCSRARSLIDAFTIQLSKGSRQVALSQIARVCSPVNISWPAFQTCYIKTQRLRPQSVLVMCLRPLRPVFCAFCQKRLYVHIHSTESAEGMVDVCIAPHALRPATSLANACKCGFCPLFSAQTLSQSGPKGVQERETNCTSMNVSLKEEFRQTARQV